MIKYLLLMFLLVGVTANAQSVSIKERLAAIEFYKKNYNVMFKEEACRRPEQLLEAIQKKPAAEQAKIRKFISDHENSVPQKILLPLVYWKFIKPDVGSEKKVYQFWLQTRLQVLRDFADNPLNSDRNAQDKARDLMNSMALVKSLNVRSPELVSDLKKQIPGIDGYTLSAGGFIPGNFVELISYNETSPERIQWFNDRVIFAGGKLDFSKPYMKMPMSTADEGHPSFKDPIFARIRDMILSSKESIFIDIFLFGGTMGGTLSKFLLDQTLEKKKSNPNFKVLLLHDFSTNYNMNEEMMPVFEYLKKRIETEPALKSSVYLLQANIHRHPPGIPFGLTNLVPKNDKTFKALEKRGTYYESKIDHSKVIVIDAESDAPQAYFGSKNWTDHSGGYYYDDALYVRGPAAAMVQASYYDDVDAALTTDVNEKKWFYHKEKGFSNDRYLGQRDRILSWFKLKRTEYPPAGNQVVRIAEANVDGKIKDTRNMLIDMIAKAESHIYMEQLFLYDPYINDALMKRKAQKPGLKIWILADHNGNFKLGGLPNTLFLEQLVKHGVEVRARRTLGIEAKFPNGKTQEYHQENHRKISSVDGKVLLVGSSNLNPDTLQGSFREFGAQIFDTEVIGKFEQAFIQDFKDSKKTETIEADGKGVRLLGKELGPDLFKIINNLGSTLFRAKDDIEKRH